MFLVALLLSALSTNSQAQSVELRGTIRDNASHQPIAGAVVTLLDSANKVLGRILTRERGQFYVAMANPVRHVRVQRLGFKPRDLQMPAAVDGVAQLDVELVPLPSLLDPVRVVVDPRCSRRSDYDRAQSLLQQARAGLLTLVVARDSYPGTVVRIGFKRRVMRKGNQIVDQEVRIDSTVHTAVSFASARSGADFVRLGFRDDATTDLLGPDADVMLDDDFDAGYCFRIADADKARPHQIGLGFAAAERKRGRVDIDGTLWMDTVARTLVDIEYRYVGLGDADVTRPGGNTSFHEMPNGVVLVDSWSIHIPTVQLTILAGRVGPDTLRSYSREEQIETGGVVLSASWPDGRTWHAPLGAVRIHATTVDHQPAADAFIQLVNTDYHGMVDSSGSLTLVDLLPGPYTLYVADPHFPEVDLAPHPSTSVIAIRDSTVVLTLPVKTLASYTAERCKADHRSQGTAALILGRAGTTDGLPAVDADITYGMPRRDPMFHFNSGSIDGVFALCLGGDQRVDTAEFHARGHGGVEGTVAGKLGEGLTTVRMSLTQKALRAGMVRAQGIAFDSLHGAPLQGATITVIGSTRTATSDSSGAFVIDSLPADRYTFVMQHDVLDAIGISGASTRATVTDGRDTVRVSVPSFATLWHAVCHGGAPPDSGIIFGSVRAVHGGAGQMAARVLGTWVDAVTDSASGFTRQGHFDVTADSAGGYALCGVPTSVSMRVRAFADSGNTGMIDLPPLDKERITRRDLVLGPLESDSMSRGVVAGVVTRDSNRVANARVLTDGVREVRTGVDGRFIIRDVPTGTRQIEVRAIGMIPVTAVVDVTKGDTAHIDIRMGKVTVLDSVRVVALTARQRQVTQFEDRRKLGIGRFKDSTEIAKSNTLANVFADMPVTVRTGKGGALTFEMLGCDRTRIWIDRVKADAFELASFRPEDLAAIEVYNAGLTPMELKDPGDMTKSVCSVVIWTKRGWP